MHDVEFLSWLEHLGPITWVRESSSLLGYTLHLALHTVGMVALVCPTLVIAARVLGLAPALPLAPMRALRPIISTGFWMTVITGSVLFATAPEGYVKNVVFIVKMASLVVGLIGLRFMMHEVFGRYADPDAQPVSAPAKALTALTLIAWLIGIVAGRLTAYSGVVVVESLWAFLVVLAIAMVSAVVYRLRPLRARQPRPAFQIDIEPTAVKGGK
jgi:hypothetical protein